MDNNLINRFLKVDPATIGHYIEGGFMKPKMKPINKHSKMVGPAYPVRIIGKDSAALYKALKTAPKGSVIVIDRGGDETFACVGEMVALLAQCQGYRGIVIDGPATDSLAIAQLDIPVFCTGISAVTTNVLGVTGTYGEPVNCSGVHVKQGDIVFGDADGVIVFPEERAEELLVRAEDSVSREVELREHFKAGGFAKIDIDKLIDAKVINYINELKKLS